MQDQTTTAHANSAASAKTRAWYALLWLAVGFASGCGGCEEPPCIDCDAGVGDAGSDAPDAGAEGADAGKDGGTRRDAGADAGSSTFDAGIDAGPAYDMFDVWREVRAAVQESPDNLPARAKALIQAGDAPGLFELVRDGVRTYPPRDHSFSDAVSRTRWGTRATLRGAAGTPREKVDLLIELLTSAGFTASVRQAAPAAGVSAENVLRPQGLAFAPATNGVPPSDDMFAAWRDVLGHSGAAAPATIIDDALTATDALADALTPYALSDAAEAFDFAALTTLPIVALTDADAPNGVRYLNPSDPGATFDDARIAGEPLPTGGAFAPETISIRLEGARADAPTVRFELVQRTYSADDVAGRRIALSFVPMVATAAYPITAAGEVSVFTPTLAVDGHDLDDAEREALRELGTTFDLGGSTYAVDTDTDAVSVDGEALGSGPSLPSALAAVQSAVVTAQAGAFERITVRVAALDGVGDRVAGLGADAFTLSEDGVPKSFTLKRNVATSPRFVLALDASTSMPPEYLGANAVTLANTILNDVYAAFPGAWCKMATINFGADFASDNWATSLAAAQTQADWFATAVGSSEIWQGLAEIADEAPTVVIFVSDGDATDLPTDEYAAAIATGPPVLSLGVGTVDATTLDALAALSGGQSTVAANPVAVTDAAIAEITARAQEDYTLTYQAETAGPDTRTVVVGIDDDRIAQMTSYVVPDVPAPKPALSGLYLTVSVGGRGVTRTLAGYEGSFTTAYVPIAQALLDEVQAQVLGRVTVAVEGAPPTLGVRFDDWLNDKLRLEPVFDAAASGDVETMQEVFAGGFTQTPSAFFSTATRLPRPLADEALTYEITPTISVVSHQVRFGHGYSRVFDYYPLRRYATADADAQSAFAQTLRRTSYLAVVEDALFDVSTLGLLDGAALRSFSSGGAAAELSDLSPEERAVWQRREDDFANEYTLVIRDGAPPLGPEGYWAIDEVTGSVMGILDGQTGGGIEDELNAELSRLNNLADLIGFAGGLAGAQVGVWVKLEKTKAALLTNAIIVISGGAANSWEDIMLGLGCGMAAEAAGATIPGAAGYFGAFSNIDLIGNMSGIGNTGGGIPGCPM